MSSHDRRLGDPAAGFSIRRLAGAGNGRLVLDQIPQHNGGTTRVVLEAYGPNGQYVTKSATVQLPCRDASSFAPSYP
ncbi:MAG TPA: hypothetical protein PLC98_25375 [Anaerolineales bacterium]|nr:hypothetical protein [Anaerolineales bacterium]